MTDAQDETINIIMIYRNTAVMSSSSSSSSTSSGNRKSGSLSIPSGVNEVQYRKALESMRRETISIDAAALQAEAAKKYALPGSSKSLVSIKNVGNHHKAKSKIDSKRVQGNLCNRNSNSSSNSGSAVNWRADAKELENEENILQQSIYNSYSDTQQNSRRPNQQHHSNEHNSTAIAAAVVDKYNEPMECSSCFEISNRSDTCTECGYIPTKIEQRHAISLAEIRGLVAAPAKEVVILKSEWDRIESKLDSRADAHCPICMSGFNQGCEVLLSCSHMFHKACLQSFENFMGKQAVRSCPICRTNNYQKRFTSKGSSAFQIVCAVKLTAFFRGYLARKKFYAGLKTFYKSGKGESKLRRRFYENELSQCTNNMNKEIKSRDSIINSMVSKTDQILQTNKELDTMFEQLIQMRAANNQSASMTTALNSSLLDAFNIQNGAENETFPRSPRLRNINNSHQQQSAVSSEVKPKAEIDWDKIKDSAFNRGLGDCAICMTPNAFYQNSSESSFSAESKSKSKRSVHYYNSSRQLTLLNCSHVFHTHCLISMEKFAKTQNRPLLCPCCRCEYDRILLETGMSHL